MPIEHKNITNADLHEPLDVNTAAVGTVYIADGVGSGDWQLANPHGGWRYANIGTGTTFTTPTAYTLMNVVGVTTHLSDVTNNSLGRLTYTGTPNRHIKIILDSSFKHSTGAGNDVFFEVYKNGVAQSAEAVVSADSTTYQRINLHWDGQLVTNDYIEIFLKVAAGNVIIHEAHMIMSGYPG